MLHISKIGILSGPGNTSIFQDRLRTARLPFPRSSRASTAFPAEPRWMLSSPTQLHWEPSSRESRHSRGLPTISLDSQTISLGLTSSLALASFPILFTSVLRQVWVPLTSGCSRKASARFLDTSSLAVRDSVPMKSYTWADLG